MKPGRELDALVAKHVMGCKVLWGLSGLVGRYGTCGCGTTGMDMYPHGGLKGDEIVQYSTDISAAWEVVEKIEDKGFILVIRDYGNDCEARFEKWKEKTVSTFKAGASAPEVICLAALKAVGFNHEDCDTTDARKPSTD